MCLAKGVLMSATVAEDWPVLCQNVFPSSPKPMQHMNN